MTQSTLTGIENKWTYSQIDGDYPKIHKGETFYCFQFPYDAKTLCEELNKMQSTINSLTIDNETLKQRNSELGNRLKQKERECVQIKNTIREAMENERTHIGYNVLKQLLEAIE